MCGFNPFEWYEKDLDEQYEMQELGIEDYEQYKKYKEQQEILERLFNNK